MHHLTTRSHYLDKEGDCDLNILHEWDYSICGFLLPWWSYFKMTMTDSDVLKEWVRRPHLNPIEYLWDVVKKAFCSGWPIYWVDILDYFNTWPTKNLKSLCLIRCLVSSLRHWRALPYWARYKPSVWLLWLFMKTPLININVRVYSLKSVLWCGM